MTGRESGQGWLGTSSRGHSLRGRLTCQHSLGCLGRPLHRPSPLHSAPEARSRPQQGVAVCRACQPELLSGGPSPSAAALTAASGPLPWCPGHTLPSRVAAPSGAGPRAKAQSDQCVPVQLPPPSPASSDHRPLVLIPPVLRPSGAEATARGAVVSPSSFLG